MIRKDDARLREAFEVAFAGEPPVRSAWPQVLARAAAADRTSRRRRVRTRVFVVVAVAPLAVPAVLLADQAWQLAVGSPTPPQVRPLLGSAIAFPTSGATGGREDGARAVVIARAETSRGSVYLLEAPTLPRTVPSTRGPIAIRCRSFITSFRLGGSGERRVQVAGATSWVGPGRECGGLPSADPNPRMPLPYGSMQVDAHLAVAFGDVRHGETVTASRIDGSTMRLPISHGGYLAVVRDDGRPARRLLSLTLRNAQGKIVRVERSFAS